MLPNTATDANLQFDPSQQLVSFYLNSELFAVPVLQVKEVLIAENITPVPGSREELLGVINLRGTMITVLNPKLALKLPEDPAITNSRIIVIDHEDDVFGILVDSLGDVITVCEQTNNWNNLANDASKDFIAGFYQQEDKSVVILLDLDRFIDHSKKH